MITAELCGLVVLQKPLTQHACSCLREVTLLVGHIMISCAMGSHAARKLESEPHQTRENNHISGRLSASTLFQCAVPSVKFHQRKITQRAGHDGKMSYPLGHWTSGANDALGDVYI